jgi:hypothetical protein
MIMATVIIGHFRLDGGALGLVRWDRPPGDDAAGSSRLRAGQRSRDAHGPVDTHSDYRVGWTFPW